MQQYEWANLSKLYTAVKNAQTTAQEKEAREKLTDAVITHLPAIFDDYDAHNPKGLVRRLAASETQLSVLEDRLEQMSAWRSNDNAREREHNAAMQRILAALGLRVLDTPDCAVANIKQLQTDLDQARERFAQRADAEHALSDAYVRLRSILGALNAGEAPTAEQVWAHTEAKAQALLKSHTQLQWALRDLLAQTRDLNDCYPEDDGYQSEALRNAIDTADALVGAYATDQFPIADEALNRRIQELEVALAEEKKKKQSSVYINQDAIRFMQEGIPRVVMGRIPGIPAAFSAPYSGNFDESKWSEEALRLVIKKVMAEREAEIADKFHETQAQLDSIMDSINDSMSVAIEAVRNKKDNGETTVTTVTMDITGPDSERNAAIRGIIDRELKPGGSIHAAIRQLGGKSR